MIYRWRLLNLEGDVSGLLLGSHITESRDLTQVLEGAHLDSRDILTNTSLQSPELVEQLGS